MNETKPSIFHRRPLLSFFIQGLSGSAMLVFIVAFSTALLSFTVIMTWLYNNTGGSLLLAVLLHLSFNVTLSLFSIPVELLLTILAGFYLVLAVIIVFAAGAKNLSRTKERIMDKDTQSIYFEE